MQLRWGQLRRGQLRRGQLRRGQLRRGSGATHHARPRQRLDPEWRRHAHRDSRRSHHRGAGAHERGSNGPLRQGDQLHTAARHACRLLSHRSRCQRESRLATGHWCRVAGRGPSARSNRPLAPRTERDRAHRDRGAGARLDRTARPGSSRGLEHEPWAPRHNSGGRGGPRRPERQRDDVHRQVDAADSGVGEAVPMREASDADAGGEERVAAEQGLSDDHLDPDEGAAYTGRVERGLRRRVLHRVEARCDGVGHEVVIEVSVAEHALHDVSQRALRVRAGPRRRQGVRVPGRRAHELVEAVRRGRQRREHEPRSVRLLHDERLAVPGSLDLVGSGAHQRVVGGIGGEQHLDVAVGAAVQHDDVSVFRGLHVDADAIAPQQGAARPEPHAHGFRVPLRRPGRGRGCRRGGGLQQ